MNRTIAPGPWELGMGMSEMDSDEPNLARRIVNLQAHPMGGLRSIIGPVAYVPNVGSGIPAYGVIDGLYHCMLHEGQRWVLLAAWSGSLYVFRGSDWYGGGDAWVEIWTGLPTHTSPRHPLQFDSDGRRVFIATGFGGPVLTYDGYYCEVLGFPRRPGSLVIDKPDLAQDMDGEIGTATSDFPGSTTGGILYGRFEYAMLLEDRWGDRSAPSSISSTTLAAEASTALPGDNRYGLLVRVPRGPAKTTYRRVYRSRDRVNVPDSNLYEVMGNLAGASNEAILPDNICESFVDTVHENSLGTALVQYMSVPRATLLCVAMGRLWLARSDDEPATLWFSEPGQMGTFRVTSKRYPDSGGAPITGLARTSKGLLVLTAARAFLVVPAQTGDPTDFQVLPIPGNGGCVAPSSVASLSEFTIWLGPAGFVAFDGEQILPIGNSIGRTMKRINPARYVQAVATMNPQTGEYTCAVSTTTARNDIMLTWNGSGWRQRDDMYVRCLTSTVDAAGVVLAAGTHNNVNAVWMLDHEGYSASPVERTVEYTSRWHLTGVPGGRSSVRTLFIMFREVAGGTATLTFYVDGVYTAVTTKTLSLEDKDRPDGVWGTTLVNGTSYWRDMRCIVKRVDFEVRSCERVAFKLTSTSRNLHLMGYSFAAEPSLVGSRTER